MPVPFAASTSPATKLVQGAVFGVGVGAAALTVRRTRVETAPAAAAPIPAREPVPAGV